MLLCWSRTVLVLAIKLEDDVGTSIPLDDIVVGEEYEGVINNVVTYGAFVDIGTEVRCVSIYGSVSQSWKLCSYA